MLLIRLGFDMAFIIYTIAEAAKDLKIGKETLRNWIGHAGLISHKVGNIDLITGDEIEILKNMEKPKAGRPSKGKF